VVETVEFKCSHCKVSGHGAVSRDCPAFVEEQKRRKARDPTAGYRYIPTHDPRTWATSRGQVPGYSEGQTNGNWRPPAAGYRGPIGDESGQRGARPTDAGWEGWRRNENGARRGGNPWSADRLRQQTLADALHRQADNRTQSQRRSQLGGQGAENTGGGSSRDRPEEGGVTGGTANDELRWDTPPEGLPPLNSLFTTEPATQTQVPAESVGGDNA
jgi:hypothetical protein